MCNCHKLLVCLVVTYISSTFIVAQTTGTSTTAPIPTDASTVYIGLSITSGSVTNMTLANSLAQSYADIRSPTSRRKRTTSDPAMTSDGSFRFVVTLLQVVNNGESATFYVDEEDLTTNARTILDGAMVAAELQTNAAVVRNHLLASSLEVDTVVFSSSSLCVTMTEHAAIDLRFLNVPFSDRDTAAEDPTFQATIRDGLTFMWGLDPDFAQDCLQSSSAASFEICSISRSGCNFTVAFLYNSFGNNPPPTATEILTRIELNSQNDLQFYALGLGNYVRSLPYIAGSEETTTVTRTTAATDTTTTTTSRATDSGAGAIIFVEVFVVPVWCYIVIAILAALLLISLIIIIILWRRKSQKQSEETNSTPTSEGYSHEDKNEEIEQSSLGLTKIKMEKSINQSNQSIKSMKSVKTVVGAETLAAPTPPPLPQRKQPEVLSKTQALPLAVPEENTTEESKLSESTPESETQETSRDESELPQTYPKPEIPQFMLFPPVTRFSLSQRQEIDMVLSPPLPDVFADIPGRVTDSPETPPLSRTPLDPFHPLYGDPTSMTMPKADGRGSVPHSDHYINPLPGNAFSADSEQYEAKF